MPVLKQGEREKLYAGHPMELEGGKWKHDGESAKIVIAFGKNRLKDGSEEVLVHIDNKYREANFTYSTKTPKSLAPILSSVDMEFDRKTAKLISFKSFTEYVHKIEFEVNLEQEKKWVNDFLASREEECAYRDLKMERMGPQTGLAGEWKDVWTTVWKESGYATIQISENLVKVAYHESYGRDTVSHEKQFTPEGDMLSIYSRSDSLGSILTLDVGAEQERIRSFLTEPEEVKKSRLRSFGRRLLDRMKGESPAHSTAEE